MSTYIDADVFVRWEKGTYDLIGYLEARPDQMFKFPATAWQQLNFGAFDWTPQRAQKRNLMLTVIGAVADVAEFSRRHAERAAELSAQLKLQPIGVADFQIAATALVDGAVLLTFNTAHFGRVPGLTLAKP